MKLKNLFFEEEETELKGATSEHNLFDANHSASQQARPKAAEKYENLPENEKNWGYVAHLAAFAGYLIPFGHILGPFLIWNLKKEESKFVSENAKMALNFQISFTLYLLLFFIGYSFVFLRLISEAPLLSFGLAFMPFLLFYLIELFVIVSALGNVSANKVYHYPFTIRFIK